MKTAILISGHLRSFDRCLPTLHWHVFRYFQSLNSQPSTLDFFVSTVTDDDAPKAQLLRTRYPNARVEIESVPEQPDCIADLRARGCELPTVWEKGKPYMHEPYNISVHPQAVARQLWQLEQCWKLFVATSASEANAYGCIIRCRPDLWFQEIEYRHAIYERQAYVPAWGGFGGVNDRFAIMGAAAAQSYFTTYSQIPALLAEGCPLHPESLVKAALLAGNATIHHIVAAFSTLRTNGEFRPPEISTLDLAHAALKS